MASKKQKKQKKDNRRRKGGEGLLRSQRVSVRKSETFVMAAQQAWERQNFQRAIGLYKEALRRDPRNADLMVDLARAYGLRQDFASAEVYLERALRSDPKRAKIQYLVGESYWMINRLDDAAACFRRVLELNPNSPDAARSLVTLARYHERHHRLDEADEAVELALGLDPQYEEGRIQQAILQRRRGDNSGAIRYLRTLLDGGCQSFQVESDAWYELGQLLDAEGDYGGAHSALQAAKNLLRQHCARANQQWNDIHQRNQCMLDNITADHFQRWHREGPASDPLRIAVLTGHPRSGTTLAEQVLDSHPDLVSADEFSTFTDWVFIPLGRRHPPDTPIPRMLDRSPPAAIAQARKDYWARTEAMLGQPLDDRLLMDKNPELTYLLPVANRVFPEMRILFALRDPRDVVLSCFMQKLPLNSVSVNYLSLEETARKYAHVMRTWLQVREWTQASWIELRYEDTVTDLESQARRLLIFLDLDWDDRVLKFYQHAQEKLVRSPTYEAVTKPVHQKAIGRWKNYQEYFAPVLEILQPYVRDFGYE